MSTYTSEFLDDNKYAESANNQITHEMKLKEAFALLGEKSSVTDAYIAERDRMIAFEKMGYFKDIEKTKDLGECGWLCKEIYDKYHDEVNKVLDNNGANLAKVRNINIARIVVDVENSFLVRSKEINSDKMFYKETKNTKDLVLHIKKRNAAFAVLGFSATDIGFYDFVKNQIKNKTYIEFKKMSQDTGISIKVRDTFQKLLAKYNKEYEVLNGNKPYICKGQEPNLFDVIINLEKDKIAAAEKEITINKARDAILQNMKKQMKTM